ncbi:amino acid/amide ABC transporter ATP-binding protein 1, HAAT family [Marinobacter segnicrescens]|uniref:Amino acid/amide ABC transporter ATP-binding protein 1, HAAT family n=1 Tax=Marinobacter segnicrescens TaxID=430453 RepID=A0A1H9ZZD7_9GAMM|nr:ABC transporter ATP-binding protein [Marinobacter segnicrescens]SES87185.1 amino acid/amide ABC transporter ATP-binding protein 1, HAAT family [Marinobacter segnicrescens]
MSENQPTSSVILETRGLTKDFRGFKAIEDVNVKVQTGHIHALIGPNGAGKTTFFNLLTKFLKPTSGKILYDGDDITNHRPADIAQHGLIRSFQISAVFPHLSARENVRIALQRKLGISYQFWRSIRVLDQLNEEAQHLLEQVDLGAFGDTKAVELAYGRKRALEIATTIALKPRLMLLDEPTQGMSAEDVHTVTDLIREVVKDRTIVMVEHNLNVVSTLADRITVLNRGRVLAEGDYDTVSTNPAVMEAYMGTTDAA